MRNLFVVTIALMIGAVQAHLFGGAAWALRVFGGLWLLVLLLVFWVYFGMPPRIYRRHPGMAGEQELRATEQGLSWSFDGVRQEMPWSELARASDTPDWIYLVPRYGMPWVVPKSVFGSDDELQAFDRLVGSRLGV